MKPHALDLFKYLSGLSNLHIRVHSTANKKLETVREFSLSPVRAESNSESLDLETTALTPRPRRPS